MPKKPNPERLDEDNPAWTAADLAKARPASEVLPGLLGAEVAKRLPNVKQHEFDAAVSFHYNTGAIARATWVRTLSVGDVALASRQIMDWRKPPEIIKRREAERDLLLLGKYPTGSVTVWGVTDAGKVIWKPAMRLPAEYALAMLHNQSVPEKPGQEPVKAPSNNLGKPGWFAGIIAAIAALLWSK